MVAAESLSLDTLDITTYDHYASRGYPWAAWDFLRREAPVFWYARPGFEPCWVLTKHADIDWVSHNPDLLSSAKRQNLSVSDIEGLEIAEDGVRQRAKRLGGDANALPDLLHMDPPL